MTSMRCGGAPSLTILMSTLALIILFTMAVVSTAQDQPNFLDIHAVPVGDAYPNAYIDGHFECFQSCSEQIMNLSFQSWTSTGFAPVSWSISIYDPSGEVATYVTQDGTFKKGDEQISNFRLRFPAASPPQGLWRFVIHLVFSRDNLPRANRQPTKVLLDFEGGTRKVSAHTWLFYVERGITGGSVGVLYRIRDVTQGSDLPDAGDHDKAPAKFEQQNIDQNDPNIEEDDITTLQDLNPEPEPVEDDDWYSYSIPDDGIYRTNFITREYTTAQSSSLRVATIPIPKDEFRIHLEKIHWDTKRILLTPYGGFHFAWDKKNIACTANGEPMQMRAVSFYDEPPTRMEIQSNDLDAKGSYGGPNVVVRDVLGVNEDFFETQNLNLSDDDIFSPSSSFPFSPLQRVTDQKFFSILLEFDQYFNSTNSHVLSSGIDVLLHCKNMTLANENVPHGISVQFLPTDLPRSEVYTAPQYTTSHFTTRYTLTSTQWSSLIHPEHIESTSSGPIPVNHHRKRESQYIWLSQHRHVYKLHNAMIPVTGEYATWFMNVTLSNINGFRLHSQRPYVSYYFGVPTKARPSKTSFPQHAIYQRLNEQRQTDKPTGRFPAIKSPMFADAASSIDTSQGAFLIIEYQLEMMNGWGEAKDLRTFTPPTFKLSVAQTDPRDRAQKNQADGDNKYMLEMVQQGDDLVPLWAQHGQNQAQNGQNDDQNDLASTLSTLTSYFLPQQSTPPPTPNNGPLNAGADKYFYVNEISTLSHFTRLSSSLKSLEFSVSPLSSDSNSKDNNSNTNKEGGDGETEGGETDGGVGMKILDLLGGGLGFGELSPSSPQIANIDLDHHYLNLMMSSPEKFPVNWSNLRLVGKGEDWQEEGYRARQLRLQSDGNHNKNNNDLNNEKNNVNNDNNNDYSPTTIQPPTHYKQPVFDINSLNTQQLDSLNQLKATYQSYAFNLTFSDLLIPDTTQVTTALFDISTARFVFALSSTNPDPECHVYNHASTHTSIIVAKSTRQEVDIDNYEATSLFFRFTENIIAGTKYSITCRNIAIAPAYAVIADIIPGKGIDKPRSPRKYLDNISPDDKNDDPIPIHVYLFTTPELDRGLWVYTYFSVPSNSQAAILAWVLAAIGMVALGAAVYTFVFRRIQKKRALQNSINGNGGQESLIDGESPALIDASGAFGDDEGGV